ncbi:ChaB family protein [Nocardiopsis suaedae]|uniref:ChaB family protein n=1 Tax=Nocardiopsis suaedae TaxID=3018444 RepID=A0ABT4TGL8_9ACTN|nr:ChaB family protein [Nocardiopsis suaedae]MDA2803867.1 ChaB family protein [Nocardiopsis suaedae]
MPGRQELPSTIQRSPRKAQDTWIKAHDSAVEEYGEGERAHRVAFAALKHKYEKVGDHWERKKSGSGPSDERAADPRAKRKQGSAGTAGGVDASATKRDLYERAQKLNVEGRSTMDKDELVAALEKESRTRTRQARES